MNLVAPFLTEQKQIKAWLDSMGVKGYKFAKDGLVDVVGSVTLGGKLGSLSRLPIRFGKVSGHFWCDSNQLVSLEGSPEKVGGSFDCYDNQLKSLEGAPKTVSKGFDCSKNCIESLEGSPKAVGGSFDCNVNWLTSMEGSPDKVGGNFWCGNNQLVSLEGVPNEVGGDFYCSYNFLVGLEGAPNKVGGDFYCNHNLLASLEGAPEEVGGDFHCDHARLVNFKGMEDVSIGGSLVVTNPTIFGPDNVFESLNGLPKDLYTKVVGLDVQAVVELVKKRAASLLGAEVVELSSEVELG